MGFYHGFCNFGIYICICGLMGLIWTGNWVSFGDDDHGVAFGISIAVVSVLCEGYKWYCIHAARCTLQNYLDYASPGAQLCEPCCKPATLTFYKQAEQP